jgi:hypothetical protein
VFSSVAISWVMNANIDLGLYRSEASYWDELKGHGELELRSGTTTGCNGTSCKDQFDVTTTRPIVGAEDQSGRLVISLPVPLSVTPSGYDMVGVESSRPGGKLTKEEQRLLFANDDAGAYSTWLRGSNESLSRAVGSGGAVKEDPHSPGNSVATFTWKGHVSVTEFASNPPTERGKAPPEPLLPGLPTQGTPVPTYSTPTSTEEKNPADFVHLILDELIARFTTLAGSKSAPAPATINAPAAPVNGQLTGTATFGSSGKGLRNRTATVVLATINSPVHASTANQIAVRFDPSGLAALRGLAGPSRLTLRLALMPNNGARINATRTVTLAPAPEISSVTFSGGPANPTVVIHGTNLGKRPPAQPRSHPSGLNGCPNTPGDIGYDYGTNLYISLPANNWAGGRSRPNLNELDCIDLVVTKFTPSDVDFRFGPFYTSTYPKFSLAPGSRVDISVNGTTTTTTVAYR